MAISTEERSFFTALGERIAALRKTRHLTQTQLAEALGVSQQAVQAYEAGRRRIPVSALPVVARALSASLRHWGKLTWPQMGEVEVAIGGGDPQAVLEDADGGRTGHS